MFILPDPISCFRSSRMYFGLSCIGLPRRLAVLIMRAFKARYVMVTHSVTIWTLCRWFRGFEVTNALPIVLRHPEDYGRKGLLWRALATLPPGLIDALTAFSTRIYLCPPQAGIIAAIPANPGLRRCHLVKHSNRMLCRSRIFFAGFPAHISNAGTLLVTTEPAPTIAPFPMWIPGRTMVPAPIQAQSSMIMDPYSIS